MKMMTFSKRWPDYVTGVITMILSFCFSDCASVDVDSDRYEDDDVQQEMARLCHRGNNDDSLIARNISKVNFSSPIGIVMIGQICQGKQCRPRSDCSSRSSLIRVYTVCHSVCIVWTHYSMVEPHSSNFRVITTNIWVSKYLGNLR